jgi:small subunit ribosomal protein S17
MADENAGQMDAERHEAVDEAVETEESEAAAEQPVAEAEPESAVEEAESEVAAAAEAEPVAESEAEPAAADEAPEPVAEAVEQPAAEAEPEPVDEEAAEPVEEAAVAPARKKKKRLPRSERRRRAKPKREQPAERKPITRLPKPEHARGRRQERQGAVVSAAGDKTIVVRVDTVKAHPMYKKVIRRSTRLHAHDEQNEAKVGDIVRIVETRPLSRLKRWRLQEIVEAAK